LATVDDTSETLDETKNTRRRRRVTVQLGSVGAMLGVPKTYTETKVAVSLDQPLNFKNIQDSTQGGIQGLLPAAIVVAGAYTSLKLYVGANDENSDEEDMVVRGGIGTRLSAVANRITGLYNPTDVSQQARVAAVTVAEYAGIAITQTWNALPAFRRECLPRESYNPCTYEGRTPLGVNSGAYRYSFKLESRKQTFGLQMGETMLLMVVAQDGEVHRAEVIPSSQRAKMGAFDIVLNKDENDAPTTAFAAMLDVMEVGEKVAARAGTNKMASFRGPPGVPVTKLHCIMSGLGALPTLEILRELLRGRESSIEQANFVWVNAREKDFVQYSEVEKLWNRKSKVLDVACVLDPNFNNEQLFENDAFVEVLPVNYEPGDMAILVGPPEFRSNVRAYLSSIANFSDGVIVDL